MTYDNSTYWRTLHEAHPGAIQTVGYPWLSKAFNELKYESEADAMTAFLDAHSQSLNDKTPSRVADIGAGTGFWTELLERWFEHNGRAPAFTVVDISERALSLIKERHPTFETVCADLTTVNPSALQEQFGLVVSCYCLHHLPRLMEFLNGLRFAARSVARNGFLLIMDPILSQPWSPFYRLTVSHHEGNGMPRQLSSIDDILELEGLVRIARAPAVSFILNGSIEARSRLGFATTQVVWKMLQRLYRSDRATRAASGVLKKVDRLLKRHSLGRSSSLVAYRKQA
jgi:SAM-dependent methyltransferase